MEGSFLQDQDAFGGNAGLPRFDGGRDSGRAGPDDDEIVVHAQWMVSQPRGFGKTAQAAAQWTGGRASSREEKAFPGWIVKNSRGRILARRTHPLYLLPKGAIERGLPRRQGRA
ncbi:MAG: hypothetical protein NVSMB23_06470 [Myxococcales bacterium]